MRYKDFKRKYYKEILYSLPDLLKAVLPAQESLWLFCVTVVSVEKFGEECLGLTDSFMRDGYYFMYNLIL